MRLNSRLGMVLSGLAGLVLPLSFSPFNLFPVAPLSVAILFAVWTQVPARRAFLCGWLYGLACFGFGVFWIHESFQFNRIAIGWALLLTGLLVMFLALYPAIVGYAVRRLGVENRRYQLLLLMPAAWVLAEWVRGWFFTGFTWLQLGYSQVGSPLQSLLPVGGIYAASWAVAVSAGLILLGLREPGRKRWLWLAALASMWIGGWLLGTVKWTEPEGDALEVALVQGNVPQDRKWMREMRRPTLERYLTLTRQHWDADLIVWPESALPGLRDNFDAYVERLATEARENNSYVMFGVPVVNRDTLEFYNSVFVVGGREMVYHKRHLVPFGEYLPLDALIRPVTEFLGLPVADFSLGPDTQPLLEAAGHRLGVSVCYEIAFGNEIAKALPEAALLVTVSNDAWFGTSIGPHQHMQIARARALETGRYLLRATNTGITAIVDPDGVIVAHAPQFEVQVLEGEVSAMGGATPYVRSGDVPVIALALLVLMGAAAMARRQSVHDDGD
ncbi:MAG: apolipoprotein N-acyltransferase [Gammaproteobacteria bacterium]|jgi:apolipoprotein N-acyltransferase|nr:apolipoprotein N-acyltransferase [Gammaproteobacteria bacterium]